MRIRECGMAHYIISRSEMCFEYEKEKSDEMNALLIATANDNDNEKVKKRKRGSTKDADSRWI